MLRMNKKVEYGVIALLHLAIQPERVDSVRGISAACQIPETLLSKIMQKMKSVGMVLPVHGNHGGYRLDRDLSQINLFDMNQALVGRVEVAECLSDHKESLCPAKNRCSIITPMGILNQKLIELFQSTSLETLARKGTHETSDLHG